MITYFERLFKDLGAYIDELDRTNELRAFGIFALLFFGGLGLLFGLVCVIAVLAQYCWPILVLIAVGLLGTWIVREAIGFVSFRKGRNN